jgi:hypothetical protein
MYKNSCGFVCEDFPKENQTLQTRNDLCFSTKPQLFLYGVTHSYLFFFGDGGGSFGNDTPKGVATPGIRHLLAYPFIQQV